MLGSFRIREWNSGSNGGYFKPLKGTLAIRLAIKVKSNRVSKMSSSATKTPRVSEFAWNSGLIGDTFTCVGPPRFDWWRRTGFQVCHADSPSSMSNLVSMMSWPNTKNVKSSFCKIQLRIQQNLPTRWQDEINWPLFFQTSLSAKATKILPNWSLFIKK